VQGEYKVRTEERGLDMAKAGLAWPGLGRFKFWSGERSARIGLHGYDVSRAEYRRRTSNMATRRQAGRGRPTVQLRATF
jgi:hypothetical protein